MANTLFGQDAKALEDPREIHVVAQSTTDFLYGVGDLVVGWMLLRSKQAPAFVAWLTLASAAFQFLLDIFSTFGGPDLGPASVISGWLWLLGIGIALLIKPTSRTAPAGVVVPATA